MQFGAGAKPWTHQAPTSFWEVGEAAAVDKIPSVRQLRSKRRS